MTLAGLSASLRDMKIPTMPDADRPLDGIRVLDLSRLLPGPFCSLLLARMGAEVIKVETPLAGDYARMAPPELGFGGVFEALNEGKRSIAVDYRKPHGRDLVLELARGADVFLESSRPGRLDRRGLGALTVRAVNPGIVYCSLSGFGQTGAHRDKPAHDIDFMALSGILPLLGEPGSRPLPAGLQLADISAGTHAAARILAALVGRARTGRGAYIDAAIVDPLVSWLGTLGAAVETAGTTKGPMSGAYPCYTTYQAADGRWLAVGALEVQFWETFCQGIGREDFIARQFDPDIEGAVAVIIGTRTSDQWLERFADDACVALVRSPAEALADEDLAARAGASGVGVPAPRLGADTDDILAEAAIAPSVVQRLIRSGVVTREQTPERAARARRLGAMLSRLAEHREAPTA